MSTYEQLQKKKGLVFIQNNKEYNEIRGDFLLKICEINAVANVHGKGRDDFKIETLLKAEELSRKVSASQSTALRKLSDQIKMGIHNMRILTRKYSENVEVVDP
jgi:hypothetical protein